MLLYAYVTVIRMQQTFLMHHIHKIAPNICCNNSLHSIAVQVSKW